MSQQFNGEVEQVAGNDIINKNNIFNIHLSTGMAENTPDPELKRAVHVLLTTCEEASCQTEIEKISKTLFGSSIFKSLSIEQLTALQVIADEMHAVLQNQALKAEYHHAAFTQEMDEYENFHSRIGIRASRPERAAITELMTTHPINPKEINLAWSNSILVYEDKRLRIKLPMLEPLMGIVLAGVCVFELLLIMVQIILVKPPLPQLAQQIPTFAVFASALIGSARYMIKPAFIGKRIRSAIEKS